MILHRSALLVGEECAVLQGDLLAQRLEAGFHQIGRGLGIEVVDGQLIELAGEKTSLHRAGLGFWQKAFLRFNPQNPQCRLVTRQGNRDSQRMTGCPSDQFFRGISPVQSERRLKHGLGENLTGRQQDKGGATCPSAKVPAHARSFKHIFPLGKAGSPQWGFVMVEAMIALSILTVLGLVLLKLSLNILHPRQWTMQQSVSDAYMTYERAYAERIPFESLLAANSPWPVYPLTVSTVVRIGALPGDVAINGTVVRTRIADTGNYPIDGGTGTLASNPAAMKVWKAQSILTYVVGNRTYAKSRTVMRSQ